MADDSGQVDIDTYLNMTFGRQTEQCSKENLRRAMDFTGYISIHFTHKVMLELFAVTVGKHRCESRWTAWVAAGKSVWWLWTSFDKPSQGALCNWYLRSSRTLSGQ